MTVNLTKSGNDFLIQGKPFDMTTFTSLKNAGLIYYKSGMRGELWEECYCGKEPVCAMCMKCSRHCTCGGGGWVITPKGVETIIAKGFDVSLNGTKLSSLASVGDAEKAAAEKALREKADRKAKYDAEVAELEKKGILMDSKKFQDIAMEWMQGMESSWDITKKDIKVLERGDMLILYRSLADKREPTQMQKVNIEIFGIKTPAVIYEYYDMEGFGQDSIRIPKPVMDEIKPLVEKRKQEEKIRWEKERAEEEARRKQREAEWKEKMRKDEEERVCKENARVQKQASIALELVKLTKVQLLEKYAQVPGLRKSWGKPELVKAISEHLSGKVREVVQNRRYRDEYREGPDVDY